MDKIYVTPSLRFEKFQEEDVVLASATNVGDSQQDIFGMGGVE